jgi:hypothetical protein
MEERVVWSRWSAIGRSSQLQVTDEDEDVSEAALGCASQQHWNSFPDNAGADETQEIVPTASESTRVSGRRALKP